MLHGEKFDGECLQDYMVERPVRREARSSMPGLAQAGWLSKRPPPFVAIVNLVGQRCSAAQLKSGRRGNAALPDAKRFL